MSFTTLAKVIFQKGMFIKDIEKILRSSLTVSIDNLVIYKLCLKDANANANARTGKEKQPLIA